MQSIEEKSANEQSTVADSDMVPEENKSTSIQGNDAVNYLVNLLETVGGAKRFVLRKDQASQKGAQETQKPVQIDLKQESESKASTTITPKNNTEGIKKHHLNFVNDLTSLKKIRSNQKIQAKAE